MRTALFLTLLLLVSGCTHTVTEQQLYKQADLARRDTIGRAYYLGRSGGHDYFRVYWNAGSTRFRVHAPNGIIQDPQPLHAPPRDMKIHHGGLTPYRANGFDLQDDGKAVVPGGQ